VPVVLNDEADDYDDLFMEPCDVADLDRPDAAELLAMGWEGALDDDEDDDVGLTQRPPSRSAVPMPRARR